MSAIDVLEKRIYELRREEAELHAARELISASGLRTEFDAEGHLVIRYDKILVDPPEPDPPIDEERIATRLAEFEHSQSIDGEVVTPIKNVTITYRPQLGGAGMRVWITIDNARYKVRPGNYNGAQIREIPTPAIGRRYELWERGTPDRVVDDWLLVRVGSWSRFYSTKRRSS